MCEMIGRFHPHCTTTHFSCHMSFVLHEIGRTAYYQWLQDPGCWKTKEKQQVFFENLSAAWSYAICVP